MNQTLRSGRDRKSHRGWLGAALSTVLFACGTQETLDLPDEQRWESAHFRYHTRSGDRDACQGILAQLERHFELIRGYLEFDWVAGTKVDYFKFLDQADYERSSSCPVYGASCARHTSVLSAARLQHHELIHAYLATISQPPAFFAEGAAIALACRYARSAQPGSWRDVVAAAPDDPRVFSEGPWFVAHLLRESGAKLFLDLYGRLRYDADADEVAAAFAATYGESIEAVWARALDAGSSVSCLFLWECSGPPLLGDGSLQGVSQACDGSDEFRTFELPAAADVLVDSGEQLLDSPVSCDQSPVRTVGSDPVHSFVNLAHFPEGRYFVGPFDLPAQVAIRVADQPLLSNSCGGDATFALDDVELPSSHFEISVPNDGGPRFVRVRPKTGNDLCLGTASQGLRVERCDGCPEAAGVCGEITCPAPVDASGSVTLRLTPEPLSGADIGYSTAYLLSLLPF